MPLNIYVPGATARDKSLYALRLRWVLLAFALAFSAMVQAQNHFYYTFNISGPTTICPGNTYTYTSPYAETIWAVNGGNIVSGGGDQVNIQWTQASGSLSGSFDTQDGGDCWYDPETWPPQLLCNPINYNHFTSNHFAVNTGINLYSLAGGTYCAGGGGVNVTLNGSQAGTTYQLKINGSNSGASVAGTGGTLTWPNQTTGGTYDVMGTRSGCTLLVGSNTVYVASSVGGTMTGGITSCTAASGLVVLANWSGTIVNWERNTGSGWTTFANTANSFNYSNITTTTQYRAWVVSGNCTGAYSTIGTVTIQPSVGGTITGGATNESYCKPASGTFTLTGHVGNVLRWEQAIQGVGWKAIPNTASATFNFSNVNQLVSYRAIVKSGVCAEVASTVRDISFLYDPTVGGNLNVIDRYVYASTATGTLNLTGSNGYVPRWEQNTGTGWTAIGSTYNLTSYTYNISQNTSFRAISKNNECAEAISTQANIYLYPAVTISPSTSQWLPYGGSVVLTVNNTYASYQWYRESTPIAGATAQQYTATQPGRYFVEVKGSAAATPATSPVTTVNSVVTYYENTQNAVGQTAVLVEGVTESTSLYTLQTSQLLQSISYQDGLGRTVQSIGVGQSPQGGDVVSVSAPSRQGLADTTFLPYVVSTSLGTYRPNAIRGSASHTSYTTSEQYLFYQNTAKVAKDNFPFARTLYASDPTLRVTEQGAPGQDWQPGNNRTVRSVAALNNATTYRVRYWKPDGTTTGNYPDNSVAVAIATDENNNQVRTYTNALGQTVLKQVQMDETLEGISTPWLETCYIYDDFGRLKYQVPPKAMRVLGTGATFDAKAASVAELIYTYTYDAKGRLVEKKVPGAAVEQIVYDNYDRPVLTQDGNQRAQNRWMFVKYDRYNRVVYSGFYARTVTRTVLQGEMDALNYNTQPFFETEAVNATTFGYTNLVFPTANLTILAVNYYDHYDFDRNGTPDYAYINNHLAGQEASALANTRNKPTGSRTRVIDAAGSATSTWLISTVFYDKYDRPIQTRSNNPLYLTVADIQTTIYDFVKVLKTKTSHFQNATTSVVLEDRSDYDRTGRVLKTFRKINANPEQLLAQYEYNALGQLVDKKLHNVGGGTFLQSIDYRYNIRGWLRSINNAQLTGDNGATNDDTNDYFGMELLYNTTESGLANTPYFNGNISAAKWKGLGTTGAIDQRSYKYLYDKSDRLKTATFAAHNGTAWAREVNTLNENVTYDHNGNIKTLTRNQNQRGLSGAIVTSTALTIDQLTYTYASNLNRLTKVEDAIATTVGVNDFKNAVNVTTEYTYTTAGDLNTDQNKGITSTTYNVLGKPRQITFNNNRRLDYFYDAAGNKTKMQVWAGSPLVLSSTTDYVGGFVYENNNLSFFSSPEGRVVKNGSAFEYQYAIADHQGNTRVVFSGAPPAAQSATANFEAATNANFQNYVNRSTFALFNRTAGGTTSQLLNGGANGRVGLAKTYRIYAGDKVKIEAYGKYTNATTTASNLAGFATALLNAYSLPAPTGGETGTPSAALNTWGGLVAGGNGGSGTVKAFVNIIVFDKNHKLLDMMWDPIDASANQVGATPVVPHDYMVREYTAKEECIVYLYVSNESATLVDVYFDDVAMTYTPSRVVQYNEYYPFQNTTQNSWTRVNATKNNFLGNGGTELNTNSQFYDLEYRHYDPVLGRMNGVDPMADKYSSLSPYNFSFNDPVTFNDVNGAEPLCEACYMAEIGLDGISAMNQRPMDPSGGGSYTAGYTMGGGAMYRAFGHSMSFGLSPYSASGYGSSGLSNGFNQWVNSRIQYRNIISGIGSALLSDNGGNVDVNSGNVTFFTERDAMVAGSLYRTQTGTMTAQIARAVGIYFTPVYASAKATIDEDTFEGTRLIDSEVGDLKDGAAFTLPGVGIFYSKKFWDGRSDKIDLLRHEFGHVLQARAWGDEFYYDYVAPISLASASYSKYMDDDNHKYSWTERTANYLSIKYFNYPKDWVYGEYPVYLPQGFRPNAFTPVPFKGLVPVWWDIPDDVNRG